jgi:hypothetical protein
MMTSQTRDKILSTQGRILHEMAKWLRIVYSRFVYERDEKIELGKMKPNAQN